MNLITVGIDYSMTCPAIAVVGDGDFTFASCKFFYTAEKAQNHSFSNIESSRIAPFDHNEERFDRISDWAVQSIQSCLMEGIPVQLFMEDYSFGSKGKTFHIAENSGLLKHKLYRLGFKVQAIPPTVIKKHATGTGAAKKEQMYDAFMKRTGIELMSHYQPKAKAVGSPVGDLVDAYFVAMCGHGIGLNN